MAAGQAGAHSMPAGGSAKQLHALTTRSTLAAPCVCHVLTCSTIIQLTPRRPSNMPTATAANTQMWEVDTGMPAVSRERKHLYGSN